MTNERIYRRLDILGLFILSCALVFPVVGCQTGSQEEPGQPAQQSPDEELVILCGSSFRAPMEQLVADYEESKGGEKQAVLMFGGSEDHLPKVKLNEGGDLFVTHSPYMRYTEEAGALEEEVQVGHLAPVLVVAKGNPKGITSIADLGKEGVQVVLPNPEFSTCGEMVQDLLKKKELTEKVMANVGNRMVRQHSEIGNQIQLGAADAGIMWNGVANGFLDELEIVSTPYEYDEEIRVAVMGLSYSDQPEKVAEFLDFVKENGQDVFREAGYVKDLSAKGGDAPQATPEAEASDEKKEG